MGIAHLVGFLDPSSKSLEIIFSVWVRLSYKEVLNEKQGQWEAFGRNRRKRSTICNTKRE